MKKAPRPVLGCLSDTELAHVLAQIDRSTRLGERDYLLVALLYDTGARIQELLDLAPVRCPIRPTRVCPTPGQGPTRAPDAAPAADCPTSCGASSLPQAGARTRPRRLIQNRNAQRLTRHGARYLLDKYVQCAQVSLPSLARARVSPHDVAAHQGHASAAVGSPARYDQRLPRPCRCEVHGRSTSRVISR